MRPIKYFLISIAGTCQIKLKNYPVTDMTGSDIKSEGGTLGGCVHNVSACLHFPRQEEVIACKREEMEVMSSQGGWAVPDEIPAH